MLGMIYETLDIKEQVSLSLHDQMYQTLKDDQGRLFLVHSALCDSIKKEWMEPERVVFFPRA